MIGPEVRQALPYPGKREARRAVARAEATVRGDELELAPPRAGGRGAHRSTRASTPSTRSAAPSSPPRELLEMLAATAATRYSVGEAEQEAVIKAQLEVSRLGGAPRRPRRRARDAGRRRSTACSTGPAAAPLGRVAALPPVDVPAAAVGGAVAGRLRRGRRAARRGRGRRAAARGWRGSTLKPDFTTGAGVGLRGRVRPGRHPALRRRAAAVAEGEAAADDPRRRARAGDGPGGAARRRGGGPRRGGAPRAPSGSGPSGRSCAIGRRSCRRSSAAVDAARASYLAGRGDFSTVVEDFSCGSRRRSELARREADRFADLGRARGPARRRRARRDATPRSGPETPDPEQRIAPAIEVRDEHAGRVRSLVVIAASPCWPDRGLRPEPAAGQQYHCPMHPTYISDRPGDCPICGMRLVPIEERTAPTTVPAVHLPDAPRGDLGPAGQLPEVRDEAGAHRRGRRDRRPRPAPGARRRTPGERKVLFYRNPMDPTVTSPVPAKDSMGMDYVPVYADEQAAPAAAGVPGWRRSRSRRGDPARRRADRACRHASGSRARSARSAPSPPTRPASATSTPRSPAGSRSCTSTSPARSCARASRSSRSTRRSCSRARRSTCGPARPRRGSRRPSCPRSQRRRGPGRRRRAGGSSCSTSRTSFIAELERTRQGRSAPSRSLAPVSGFVTAKDVFEGQQVEPGMELFTVADLSRVWVEADFYEYEARRLRARPGGARSTLPYDPPRRLERPHRLHLPDARHRHPHPQGPLRVPQPRPGAQARHVRQRRARRSRPARAS